MNYTITIRFAFALTFIFAISGCIKPLRDVADYYPVVKIVSHTINPDGSITITSRIEDEGASEIEYTGTCLSEDGTPEGAQNQLLGNTSGSTFTTTYEHLEDADGYLLQLNEDSTYYVRAFATNSYGYAYSDVYVIAPYTIPAVDAPCTPAVNTMNYGSGNMSTYVPNPSTIGGNVMYSLNATTASGSFTFSDDLETGIYTTTVDPFPLSNEVRVAFTSFNVYVISEGALVYVNETSDNVFDVRICDAPYLIGSSTAYFTARFTAD